MKFLTLQRLNFQVSLLASFLAARSSFAGLMPCYSFGVSQKGGKVGEREAEGNSFFTSNTSSSSKPEWVDKGVQSYDVHIQFGREVGRSMKAYQRNMVKFFHCLSQAGRDRNTNYFEDILSAKSLGCRGRSKRRQVLDGERPRWSMVIRRFLRSVCWGAGSVRSWKRAISFGF